MAAVYPAGPDPMMTTFFIHNTLNLFMYYDSGCGMGATMTDGD